MPKSKKRASKKKASGKKKNKKDIYALIVFFMAYYFTLNLLQGMYSWFLGLAFLIAFLYGIICVSEGKKFIFD